MVASVDTIYTTQTTKTQVYASGIHSNVTVNTEKAMKNKGFGDFRAWT